MKETVMVYTSYAGDRGGMRFTVKRWRGDGTAWGQFADGSWDRVPTGRLRNLRPDERPSYIASPEEAFSPAAQEYGAKAMQLYVGGGLPVGEVTDLRINDIPVPILAPRPDWRIESGLYMRNLQADAEARGLRWPEQLQGVVPERVVEQGKELVVLYLGGGRVMEWNRVYGRLTNQGQRYPININHGDAYVAEQKEKAMNRKNQELLAALQGDMQTVGVRFVNGDLGKTYTYKVPKAWGVEKDMHLVVMSPSGLAVVRVAEVHATPRIELDVQYKWAVQVVDTAEHDERTKREAAFLEQLAEAERLQHRTKVLEEARKALGAGTAARRKFDSAVRALQGASK